MLIMGYRDIRKYLYTDTILLPTDSLKNALKLNGIIVRNTTAVRL